MLSLMRVTSLRGIGAFTALLLTTSLIAGCGDTVESTSTTAPSANYKFQVALAKHCVDKKQDIARLGYVRMTRAGIDQIGLEAAKSKLAGYLEKLLAIQERYAKQRAAIVVPAALQKLFVSATVPGDRAIDETKAFKNSLPRITTSKELERQTAAWLKEITAETKLANAASNRLGVPECVNNARQK